MKISDEEFDDLTNGKKILVSSHRLYDIRSGEWFRLNNSKGEFVYARNTGYYDINTDNYSMEPIK